MIDLYYYTSPNARKVVMALEELGLEYAVRWVDLAEGDQHAPEYRRINPNGRIPAIVDHDGPEGRPVALFESGAILHYLAEKTGELLPADPADRWWAICWVHWQVANQGPMLGQAAHFVSIAANRGITDSYARDRYLREAERLYRVLEEGLGDREYLAGTFSIADIAAFPWVRVAKGQSINVADYPAVHAWSQRVAARPSAKVKIPDQRDEAVRSYNYTDEQWATLFGSPEKEPAVTTNATTISEGPKMTIDGQSVGSDAVIEVADPALGEVCWTVPDCSLEQLDAAVAGAAAAFPAWAARPMEDRQSLLLEVISRVEENKAELADLLTREQGKPLANATSEINSALGYCKAYAKMSLPPEVVVDDEGDYVEIRRVPLGVVAAITAWNYPLLLSLWKIAPALVAGNTVVVKPSPFTPMATLRLGELLADVLPAGVLQVVSGGDEVGRRLTTHPDVAKVSFTGSVATGREIMASAAPTLKRLTLELGGNDPGIVLPDFDLDGMADTLYWTAFSNNGQVCAGLKRLYVPEAMADELCDRLAAVAETVRVGNGLEPDTTTGPVQNPVQLARIRELMEDAREHGAEIAYQGKVPEGPGWFYPITIVRGVTEGVRLVDEEPFGPVLPVLTYTDLDEAVQRANASEYGLGASVWSPDVGRATAVAERLQAGTVWVNRHPHLSPQVPFGGIRQSGIGVESSVYGLQAYTDLTVLDVKRG